jgi:hypothetical protein
LRLTFWRRNYLFFFFLAHPVLTCLAWETLPVASYRQHSSQGHVTSQATPLRQSRDALGGLQVYALYI